LESNKPPAPENLNVANSPPSDTKADNVAFIAKQFNITEFQNETVEIFLRESKGNRRRKRNAVDVYTLIPNTTYRIAQMNTDGFEVSIYKTDGFGVSIYKTLAKNDFVIFIFRPIAR
jgi:myo-inositol-hexaphosphate 3-phosphohydrolase